MNLTEKRHVKALDELARAGRRPVAAFACWQRLRLKVRRYDAAAERKLAGEYDQFARCRPESSSANPTYQDCVTSLRVIRFDFAHKRI